MASTIVGLTPGVGANVGFDQVTLPDGTTSAKVQAIKLVVGGESDAIGWVSGREVDGTTDEATFYVEQRGHHFEFTPTITVTAGAYVDGDNIGGLISVTTANKASGGGVRIDSVTIIDKENTPIKPEMDVLFLKDSISAPTDADPFDPSDTDLAKARHVFRVLDTDYSEFANNAVASLSPVGGLIIPALTATTLYVVLIARAGFTFTGTDNLAMTICGTKL